MADVLIMITCQFGHPITEFVLMETDYALFHSLSQPVCGQLLRTTTTSEGGTLQIST